MFASMRILYYTSGIPGIGRIVHGIALKNAFDRAREKVDFAIVSCNPLGKIAEPFGISHTEIPLEEETAYAGDAWRESALYRAIESHAPDVVVVDKMWFTMRHFAEELVCKKIFMTLAVRDEFFTFPGADPPAVFDPSPYDRVVAIEPFTPPFAAEELNPLIIRNRDEILPRERALAALGLDGRKKICFVGINVMEGMLDALKKKYSYLDGPYRMLYSSNMAGGGIFPIADYYNAIDLVVSTAGYNQFWESVYFDKEALFENVELRFTDMADRVERHADHRFDVNGADQLAGIIMGM